MNHRKRLTPGWKSAATILLLLGMSAAAWSIPAPTSDQGDELDLIELHLEHGRLEEARKLADELHLDQLDADARLRARQMLGYLSARLGDYPAAVSHYQEAALAASAIAPALEGRIRYTVAQLHFAVGDFTAAVAEMRAWQSLGAEAESFGPWILMGQAYFKVNDYSSAIRSMETGLARAEAQGAAIREHWLELLHHLYVEQRQWREATAVLERLTSLFPSPRYQRLLEQARSERG